MSSTSKISDLFNSLGSTLGLVEAHPTLQEMVEAGDMKVIGIINARPAVVDQVDVYANTLLHLAAKLDRYEIAEALIANGAQVNIKNHEGNSPLHLAARLGSVKLVALLINHKADVNLSNMYGEKPLFAAVEGGQMEIVVMLKNAGAYPVFSDSYGNTLLHAAAKAGHTHLIDYLLAAKLDVDEINMKKETPFFLASQSGWVECAQKLLDCGASSVLSGVFNKPSSR